jgi:hypothetical protein
MNLYSVNLDRLTAEFPSDADAVRRLIRYLERYANQAGTELSAKKLYDESHPSSQRILVRILQRLIDEGVLEQIVRVESDEAGGIADFPSLGDVPEEIHDWRRDRILHVTPDNLRLIYKVR